MLCFDGGGCRSNFALNSGPELADHARDPAISLVDHGPCDAHALAREVAAADGQSRPQPDTRPSVTVSADAALPNDLPQQLTLTGRRPESHRPGTKSRATGAWTAYEPYAKRVCPAIALEVFRIAMAAVAVRGTHGASGTRTLRQQPHHATRTVSTTTRATSRSSPNSARKYLYRLFAAKRGGRGSEWGSRHPHVAAAVLQGAWRCFIGQFRA